MTLEKQLAEDTLLKLEREMPFIASGVRELDEMVGGGFRPGTLTLIQESVGAGGVILLKNIIETQLAMANQVLVIYSDPTLHHYITKLDALQDPNLTILDLLPKASGDLSFNRHDINLRIKDARSKLSEGKTPVFVIMLTINPFFLNLEEDQVIRILNENLLLTLQYKTIDLMLIQKGLVSESAAAKLQSLAHGVIDLTVNFGDMHKNNTIRVLKMVEAVPDVKTEPFEILYDKYADKERFLINTAFLTSFETFRSLIKWHDGEITLSEYPYLIVPLFYFNSLLDIALSLDPDLGKQEIRVRARTIGRKLTRSVERLYVLSGTELLRACIRTMSLQGWGAGKLRHCKLEENLISIKQCLPEYFYEPSYKIFLEGLYAGIIKTIFHRNVREVQFKSKEKETRLYKIQLQLDPLPNEEAIDYSNALRD